MSFPELCRAALNEKVLGCAKCHYGPEAAMIQDQSFSLSSLLLCVFVNHTHVVPARELCKGHTGCVIALLLFPGCSRYRGSCGVWRALVLPLFLHSHVLLHHALRQARPAPVLACLQIIRLHLLIPNTLLLRSRFRLLRRRKRQNRDPS